MMIHLSFPDEQYKADTKTANLMARCSGNGPRFRTITRKVNLVTCKSCLRVIAAEQEKEYFAKAYDRELA